MNFLIYIWFGMACVLILPLSILAHEAGHVLAFKDLGRDVKIKLSKGVFIVGKDEDYKNLSRNNKRYVYACGILAGLIPIALMGYYAHPILYAFIIPYAFGCKNDIKNLYEVRS